MRTSRGKKKEEKEGELGEKERGKERMKKRYEF